MKYSRNDLMTIKAAHNEGCLLPRPAKIGLNLLFSLATMALAVYIMAVSPWVGTMVAYLEAIASWGVVEVAVFAVFIAIMAIVMLVFTIPVTRLLLSAWFLLKIRASEKQ